MQEKAIQKVAKATNFGQIMQIQKDTKKDRIKWKRICKRKRDIIRWNVETNGENENKEENSALNVT